MEIIKATKGKYLTQVSPRNEGERVFATELYLAQTDSAGNWREADQAEYEAWTAEREKETQEELEKLE